MPCCRYSHWACGDTDAPEVPGPTLTPQPIGYPDIEANSLHGANCAYASGTSMAPIVLAFADQAVMKVDGAIRRFEIDGESQGEAIRKDARYLADDRVLLLTLGGDAAQDGKLTGTVRLLDGAGAELFATSGAVQCGSSGGQAGARE